MPVRSAAAAAPPTHSSQKTLARQLNLPRRLACSKTTSRDADPVTVCELKLVLVCGPGARAVVGEVDAGEGVGAEVVFAVGYKS